MDFQQEYFQETNPKARTNIISNIFFLWTIPFIRRGQKADFDINDLYKTLKEDFSRGLNDRLEKEWRKELLKVKKHSGDYRPSFSKAVFRTFGAQTFFAAFFVFIEECILRIAQPFAIFKIVSFFSSGGSSMTLEELYVWAGVLIGAGILFVLFDQRYWYQSLKTGMQIRIAASALIYRKALTLSNASLGKSSTGQMVNLISNDVNRFDNSTVFLQYLWVAPLQFVIVMLITTYFAGVEAIAGGCLLICFIFFQTYMGKMFSKLRSITASKTDIRIQIMNEILDGIKVIKMYAWESPFVQLVMDARKNEMSVIKQTAGCKSFNYAFFSTSSRFILLPVFLLMVLLGGEISAQKIFLIFGLFEAIKLPLTHFFPSGISASSEALVSMKRIEEFLLLKELTEVQSNINQIILPGRYEPLTVEVSKVSGKWDEDTNVFDLKNISFSVEVGELCAIIGPVGSGKSTIIQALLGEFPISYGEINIKGRISYASQEPWIFSGTVRQNILMGKPLIEKRYREVMRVCALEHDIREWPDGDYTFVGEKGISLSGGQKARINLARCVYTTADIYILDDPLSAVDAHVGKELFNSCIQKYLSEKTVILVTHQLQFLQSANNIILLTSEGEIEAEGTYEKLMGQSGFVTYLEATSEEENSDIVSDVLSDAEYIHSKKRSRKQTRSRKSSTSLLVPVPYIGSVSERDSFSEEKGSQEWKISNKEMVVEGSVSLGLYYKYLVSGGGFFKFLVVYFLSLITHTLFVVSDWWLRLWTNAADARKLGPLPPSYYFSEYQDMTLQLGPNFTIDLFHFIYCGIYMSLILVLLFSAQFSVRQLFMSCMRSSQTLHDNMFEKVAFTNSRFFDLNPSGRILNRFSKDIGSIDELLPPVLIDTNWALLSGMGIFILISITSPVIVIGIVVLLLVLLTIRRYYLNASRAVKRLEGITRSPVFSQLSSSLDGLSTIRSMKIEEMLIEEFDYLQDIHTSSYYSFLVVNRFFAFCGDLMLSLFTASMVSMFLFYNTNASGGDVGLSLTLSLALCGMIQWGLRQSAEVENFMTSVERVAEYGDLEKEKGLTSDIKLDPSWPDKGVVEFSRVSLKYDKSTPYVLKGLSFKTAPYEKIGIVGRTGAGKSSMISALFRLAEPEGKIFIDGVNICRLSLQDVRKKISIIPQDPLLFKGTIRKNLDPFNEHGDLDIWHALEQAKLSDTVSELKAGLESEVSDGGNNFSMGQRQLFCLARAILRKNKVLVMDEATANVDPMTDALIQETIRTEFKDCTVFTIAHRLYTVMDSDRMLVMSDGQIEEFGPPLDLLNDSHSIFSQMVNQLGPSGADKLRKIAQGTF